MTTGYIKENIGQEHPLFVKTGDEWADSFTQVAVKSHHTGAIVAVFVGPIAKIRAIQYISKAT